MTPQTLNAIAEEIAAMVLKKIDPDVIAMKLDPEHTFSTKEAAAFLNIDTQRILLFSRNGLPRHKLGKGFGFRRADLIAFRDKYRETKMWK